MSEKLFETPILFLIFNRPDTTQQVFDQIKLVKPAILYVGADGPRENKEGEAELCQQTRNILQQIDWECELHTLFREKNLGCADAVRFAIDWFFEREEGGIILEEDCVPSADFFRYCQDLLIKYQDETRVMMISGYTPISPNINQGCSFYFARLGSCWGWATWKRAWNKYDYALSKWLDYCPIFLHDEYYNSMKEYREELIHIFYQLYDSTAPTTWDYQWAYTMIINNGMNIMPCKNLITNIGMIGAHYSGEETLGLFSSRYNLEFPLKYPEIIKENQENDSILGLWSIKSNVKYNLALKLAVLLRKCGYFPKFECIHPVTIGFKIKDILNTRRK